MSLNQEIRINNVLFHDVIQSDLIEIFKKYHNESINPYYRTRSERNQFAAKQIECPSTKRVLNLGGGGKRHLKQSFYDQNIEVYEVDIQGDCDLKTNLDEISNLPFEDNTFDVVCAFDVLEHLNNFHLINDEMFRVSKKSVLISLPNSLVEVPYMLFGKKSWLNMDKNSGVFSKFYGLPLKKPDDRHRWWLYFQDIIRFYYYFSLERHISIEFWTPNLKLKQKLFRAIAGSRLYYTLFCPYIWIKLTKN